MAGKLSSDSRDGLKANETATIRLSEDGRAQRVLLAWTLAPFCVVRFNKSELNTLNIQKLLHLITSETAAAVRLNGFGLTGSHRSLRTKAQNVLPASC